MTTDECRETRDRLTGLLAGGLLKPPPTVRVTRKPDGDADDYEYRVAGEDGGAIYEGDDLRLAVSAAVLEVCPWGLSPVLPCPAELISRALDGLGEMVPGAIGLVAASALLHEKLRRLAESRKASPHYRESGQYPARQALEPLVAVVFYYLRERLCADVLEQVWRDMRAIENAPRA